MTEPSVAALAAPLVSGLIDGATALRLGVARGPRGVTVVDAGIARPGGLEAGRRIAEICLGGLGRVTLQASPRFRHWPTAVTVTTAQPVLACLGSQYAGWSLAGDGFHALGSGPGRALAAKEALFEELGYRDRAEEACLVLEVDRPPPEPVVDGILEACGIAADRLTLILTPTQSLAGAVQIVARVLEVALHKAHAVGFPLARIVDGIGTAPLPPPSPDFLTAMGRTNDATFYGGEVHLFVTGPETEAAELAEKLPSSASRDYGEPFAEVFRRVKGDFYAIDSLLFSPARTVVTALDTGRSFAAGRIDEALIDRSFGHAV